jgi:hypothetical protein
MAITSRQQRHCILMKVKQLECVFMLNAIFDGCEDRDVRTRHTASCGRRLRIPIAGEIVGHHSMLLLVHPIPWFSDFGHVSEISMDYCIIETNNTHLIIRRYTSKHTATTDMMEENNVNGWWWSVSFI